MSLKRLQTLIKTGVKGVTRVRANTDAAFAVTPKKNEGVTSVTRKHASISFVTPVTRAETAGVTWVSAPILPAHLSHLSHLKITISVVIRGFLIRRADHEA